MELVRTGEMSGALDDLLRRAVVIERDRLADDDKMLGDWIPRLVYFTVGLFTI